MKVQRCFPSHSQSTLEFGETLTSPNIHDVASILKRFLRELPTPLIPPSLTPALQWVWSHEMKELVLCVLLQLPQPHLLVRETTLPPPPPSLLHSLPPSLTPPLPPSLTPSLTPSLPPSLPPPPPLSGVEGAVWPPLISGQARGSVSDGCSQSGRRHDTQYHAPPGDLSPHQHQSDIPHTPLSLSHTHSLSLSPSRHCTVHD